MKATFLNIIKSSLFTTGLAVAAATFAAPAEAFTLGYNGYFGSTNDPATGASATVDFTFTDLADGSIQLDLLLTNTTGQANMTEGLTTDGATESEFLSVGFDFADGDLADKLNIVSYSLGDPAFDEIVYDDTSLSGGTSSSTAINGDGWGNVSLNDITFDVGLITSGNLLSTGNPRDGLNAGASETVTFNLAPTDFAGATELEQWFVDGFVEGGYLTTAARFKAVDGTNIDGGSDKLLGGSLQEYFDYNNGGSGDGSSSDGSSGDGSSGDGSSGDGSSGDGSSGDGSSSDGGSGGGSGGSDSVDVPEPGTLLGLAVFAFGGLGFRRKKQ